MTTKETTVQPTEKDAASPTCIPVYRPRVDVLETPESVILRADLPGVSQEDLTVEIKSENLLEIRGRTSAATGVTRHRTLLAEYHAGDFSRVFQLSDEIDAGRIQATLINGVLTIELPKIPVARPRTIEIQSN